MAAPEGSITEQIPFLCVRVTGDVYRRHMRWVELSESEPRLVEVAHDRLIKPGVLLVVTIRRDGTPRLSPVEPLIFEDDLWLSMMWHPTRRSTCFATTAS